MDCEEVIYSEDYADYILEIFQDEALIKDYYQPTCIQGVSQRFTVIYQPFTGNPMLTMNQYGYHTIPKLYGLLDVSSLESMGVMRLRRQPYLDFTGRGVLIGIIDTGIDYQNPCFIKADGTSRIVGIWDQTQRGGMPPEGILYGTEYKKAQIDQALTLEDPYQEVPTRDEVGHGTFMAAVAAGNVCEENQFSGVAPQAELLVVKLKEAKQALKEYYGVRNNTTAFSESDILVGVRYLFQEAERIRRPIVVCIGIGTNSGNHSGQLALPRILDSSAVRGGVGISVAAGNEGNRGHHYFQSALAGMESEVVELRIAEGESALSFELWSQAPGLFTIAITTPLGESTGVIPLWVNKDQGITFPLEQTRLYVYYSVVESYTGDELVFVQMTAPTPGIWKITVYNQLDQPAGYHIWLPMEQFVEEETRFLRPDSNTTICEPGNAVNLITMAAYNHKNDSLYLNSSRGYTSLGEVKPDLVSPGVDIYGPVSRNRFGSRTGSSIAAANGAGCCALMLEWGYVNGASPSLQTTQIKNYFIRGAVRKDNVVYPNPEWGYGQLDIYNTFQNMNVTS